MERLRNVTTSDGWRLDVMVSQSDAARDPRATLVHLHGKGGNFYSGPGRFIPVADDTDDGFRHLSVNMRCHDLAYTRYDKPYVDFEYGGSYLDADGGYWEDLSVGHLDVRAAVELARGLGDQPVFLVGHSSGGYYAADYVDRYRDVAGRILLSPLLSNRRAVNAWFPEPEALAAVANQATALVAGGQGRTLIPVPGWFFAISATSLVQRLEEEDDPVTRRLQKVSLPTLILWGGAEPRGSQWESVAHTLDAATTRTACVPEADHSYLGAEAAVTAAVRGFVEEVLAATPGLDHDR